MMKVLIFRLFYVHLIQGLSRDFFEGFHVKIEEIKRIKQILLDFSKKPDANIDLECDICKNPISIETKSENKIDTNRGIQRINNQFINICGECNYKYYMDVIQDDDIFVYKPYSRIIIHDKYLSLTSVSLFQYVQHDLLKQSYTYFFVGI